MTTAEKIETVRVLVNDDKKATPQLVRVLLLSARQDILDRLYSLIPEDRPDEVPEQYAMMHCQLAARRFLRMGAEGQTSMNENGIERTWGSVDDEDILSRLTPIAKVVM